MLTILVAAVLLVLLLPLIPGAIAALAQIGLVLFLAASVAFVVGSAAYMLTDPSPPKAKLLPRADRITTPSASPNTAP